MALKGYCPNCKILVDMVGIQTIRLANKQYVQSGACAIDGSSVVKAIADTEMLIVPPGYYFPKTVYAGKDTPSKIINDHNGQQIITAKGVVISTTAKDKNIKTLAQIEEGLNEDQKNIRVDVKRDAVVADMG